MAKFNILWLPYIRSAPENPFCGNTNAAAAGKILLSEYNNPSRSPPHRAYILAAAPAPLSVFTLKQYFLVLPARHEG